MYSKAHKSEYTSTTVHFSVSDIESGACSSAGSRRRQKGSDNSSTSDEEHDVCSKMKCSHTSTQTQTQQRPVPTRLDIEDEEAQNEHYQNWTNHSAEIARSFMINCAKPDC